jgi:predicted nucleic acid-binding protein
MSGRVFIDTNIFAYVFDESDPTKQAEAVRTLERERDGEVVASTQVLQELYVCLTRGADPIASSEVAERAVLDVAKLTIVQIDAPLIHEAIVSSRRNRISFWDALIVRAASTGRCDRLLTEDLSHGQVLDGVRVENPFVTRTPHPARRGKR